MYTNTRTHNYETNTDKDTTERHLDSISLNIFIKHTDNLYKIREKLQITDDTIKKARVLLS